MNADLLAEKLESLRRCLARVEKKTPASAAALKLDLDAQDIVTLNLERAVQQVVDIALLVLSETDAAAPGTMADSVRALAAVGAIEAQTSERMAKAVGFRNVAVHAYQALDWDIVFAIATRHLDDFRQFMREVVAYGRL